MENNYYFINLTPHDINIVGSATIPRSGIIARISSKTEEKEPIMQIPVSVEKVGVLSFADTNDNIVRLEDYLQPNNVQGACLVLSRIAAMAILKYPEYDNLGIYVPGDLVRDENGTVIGCRGLIQIRP